MPEASNTVRIHIPKTHPLHGKFPEPGKFVPTLEDIPEEDEYEYFAIPDAASERLCSNSTETILPSKGPTAEQADNWGSTTQDDDSGDAVIIHVARLVDNLDKANKAFKITVGQAQSLAAPEKESIIKEALNKLLIDAVPGPTPGSTAVYDYTVLASDFQAQVKKWEKPDSDEDPSTFLTPGGGVDQFKSASAILAGMGSALDYYNQLQTLRKEYNRSGTATGQKQTDAVRRTAAADGMTDAVKIVDQLGIAVSSIATLANAAPVQAIPGLGIAAGFITAFRSIRKTHRARKRYSAFQAILNDPLKKVQTEEMREILKYAISKTFRKTAVGSAGAASGLAGSSGAIMLAVGGAAAVPIAGWICIGVAAIGGAGIVSYKVFRRHRNYSKRRQERVSRGGPANSCDMAKKLIAIARNAKHSDQQVAVLILESFGVKVMSDLGSKQAQDEAIKMVDRHLKHV
jgi:hypothetical protein